MPFLLILIIILLFFLVRWVFASLNSRDTKKTRKK